ncbi:SpoIIE family protein phosphatase [Peptoniphilus raoultii]|uniref:SpoIIE family protein phosphatase n=1 Tax=Peptoniphilus raoultii TaxID=1776387 RepID=UPI0008DA92A3|nr:SpoIIE family protein phosphatase [Peptoniphilus raoultii]
MASVIREKIDMQILNGIADLVRVLDDKENVVFVNEAMEKALGYDRENGICYIDESVFNPEITRRALNEGIVIQRQETVMGQIYSVKCSPILGDEGKITGVVEVFRNVTVERKLQREILDKNREMTDETLAASKIQKTVLPPKGFLKNLKIDYFFRPSNILSGDMFDVFEINKDNIAIYIADSVGHGFAASMVTMFIKSLIRTLTKDVLLSPVRTLKSLSGRFKLLKLNIENYFTCFYGVFNVKKGIFTYANAGHQPLPIKVSYNIENLEAEGFPISGFLKNFDYQEKTVKCYSGDKILFMTDGITEAKNMEGEVYGKDRVIEILRENDIDEIKILKEDIRSFMNVGQVDDMSAVLISMW